MFIGKEQFILLISIDVDDEALGYTIEDTIEQIKLDITAAYPEASNIYIEVKDSVRNNKI
jgi:hypothetical protein